jgi:hypothetical protein
VRNILFWLGPPLLFIGTGIIIVSLFYLPFLIIIGGPFFFLGTFFIKNSSHPSWVKRTAFFSTLAVWPIGLYVVVPHPPAAPRAEPITFLVPEGFRGEVAVVGYEGCGQPLPRIQGDPVVTVPPSGLVITSDKLNEHTLEASSFYVVNKQGERLRALAQLIDRTQPASSPPQEIGVLLAGQTELPPVPYELPITYLSFAVTCLDSAKSHHQSPDLYEKLVRGADVPPNCQIRLSRSPR